MSAKIEKLENHTKSKWGGRRERSGRKPLAGREEVELLRQQIEQHGIIGDEDEGKTSRLLILLDKLYALGKSGNVVAIKEYLDRQLGKSKETLDITTKGETIYGEKQIESIAKRILSRQSASTPAPDRLPNSDQSELHT